MEVLTPRERIEQIVARVCEECQMPRRIIFDTSARDAQAVRLRHRLYIEMFDAGFNITAIARFTGNTYQPIRQIIVREHKARRERAKAGRNAVAA